MDAADALTAESLGLIARRGPQVNLDLVYGEVRVDRCETLVIRVPPAAGEAVVAALSRFRALNPRHHVYSPAALHVTVTDLTPAVLAGHDVEELLAVAREVLRAAPPFDLRLRGIAVLPYSLVVPVAPDGNGAARLRAALAEALAGRLPAVSPRPLYATAARFTGAPLHLPEELVAEWRRRDLGSFPVNDVALVNTDKLFDHGRPVCRARLSLAPARLPERGHSG